MTGWVRKEKFVPARRFRENKEPETKSGKEKKRFRNCLTRSRGGGFVRPGRCGLGFGLARKTQETRVLGQWAFSWRGKKR